MPSADSLSTCGPDDRSEGGLALLPIRAEIFASSEGLGWQGLQLEVGRNTGCDFEEAMVDGHYVGLLLNDQPIDVHHKVDGTWMSRSVPSRSLWIHPEGTLFSVRHRVVSKWAGAVIDGAFLDDLAGCHIELRGGYTIEDELLANLLMALVNVLTHPDRDVARNAPLTEALIRGFALALAARRGVRTAALPSQGGIAPHQLKNLQVWLERNIGSPIRVEAMAERVNLSPSHFSREFKRSMGMTPWNYVMELRLNRAMSLLRRGDNALSVAYACGFYDQSHLCRKFRAHFGISPGEITKCAVSG